MNEDKNGSENRTNEPLAQVASSRHTLDMTRLTAVQLEAVELLLGGVKPGKVAERLGVTRTTVWRWRNQNPDFARELERLRHEFHESRIDEMWSLADKSLEVLEEHLEEGDIQAAGLVLRLVGPHLMEPRRPIPMQAPPTIIDVTDVTSSRDAGDGGSDQLASGDDVDERSVPQE